MQTCADETDDLQQYAAWAAQGYEQYFEFQFHAVLTHCGLSDQIAYTMEPGTCGGGMSWAVQLRDSCPSADATYETFTAQSCGENVNGNKCGNFLVELSEKRLKSVSAGK